MNEDPTTFLIEQVQKAALGVIEAARACLDVAEGFVRDPGGGAPAQDDDAGDGVEHIEVR